MSESDPIHPSGEQLRAFASGAVEDAEVDRIGAHLDECAVCRAVVDGLLAQDALVSRLQAASRLDPLVLEDEAQRRQAVRALQQGRFRDLDAGVGQSRMAPREGPPSTLKAFGPDATPHHRPRTPGEDEEDNDDEPGESEIPSQIGEYEIAGEIGRGGMGVVYKARHRRLNRPVALKMILSGPFASATQRRRFQLEAELAARVQHPNVVRVHEVGTYQGRTYLAMEWVEGGTLAGRLDGRPWPPAQAARLIESLAWGTHAAHIQGVVHRDLKPGNILLAGTVGQPDFVPKIADFSLARPIGPGLGLTTTGLVVGTPEYMAPEQAGSPGTPLGPAVDVYALGVLLYELLTGRVPYRGSTALEVLQAACLMEPVRPCRLHAAIPRELEAIALKCMEKQPHRRYGSAQDLAIDLERFRQRRPIAARPAGRAAQAARWCRRNRGTPLLLSTLAGVLLAGVCAVSWKWREVEDGMHGDDCNLDEQHAMAWRHLVHPDAPGLEGRAAGPRSRYFNRQSRPMEDLSRPNSEVVVRLSDGCFAAVGPDGTLHVWDAASGKQLLSITAHGGPVNIVTCSPDAPYFAWTHAKSPLTVKLNDFAAPGRNMNPARPRRPDEEANRSAGKEKR